MTTQLATDSCGNNGGHAFRKCQKEFAMEQKRLQIVENYYKKFYAVVGKDEVSGSNPDSSSTKAGLFFGKGRLLL